MREQEIIICGLCDLNIKAEWEVTTLADCGFQDWEVCDNCLEELKEHKGYLSLQTSSIKKLIHEKKEK